MAWNCSTYYDYLFDRTPHWDQDILRDWFPTDDAWIGQVATGSWESFTGTQHTYDRIHMGAPDLSQAWGLVDHQSMLTNNGMGAAGASTGCVTNACNPSEIAVGYGATRKTYDRYRQSYGTEVFCFDQINTRAKAKEQIAGIIEGLRDITKQVQADYLRTAAVMFSDKIYIAGSALTSVSIGTSTFTGQALTIDIGGAGNKPTSQLTVPYLQRFYEPLQAEGYFKGKYVPNGIFKLITDPITSQQLTSGNPALIAKYQFSDFQKGGQLFKYGMSAGVGNFGIAWDYFPARFYWDSFALVMRRAWPHKNVAAGESGGPTMGVKKVVATEYELAPYQLSYIWHPEAMRRYVPSLTSVNPEMPFLTRDLAGKWNFVGGNRDRSFVVTRGGTTCTINNSRGNQGYFYADFENSIRFDRPELVRAILHEREPGCVTNSPACSTPPAYVTQSWSAAPPCGVV
jgi:hypothetical protein